MSSSSTASSPSLRAAIQEVADALACHDFEESSALYALAGLVRGIISELRRCFPGLLWSLIVMPPSTEEVPPLAKELPPVEDEEEVVAPVTTR
ncbi:hypothetical protein NEOLEDRAFT_1180611 [Neolentinus lepideus HHB14362 ss-1]|uniref:Uncharacterized protein n=1 Tax=Neolentinus lepideus HHB14362 ss-1 TaxID=1314782 RepID=A0A165QTS3_9AGAM|nr:hypothetical protein NEOLEDRAFT_1180611 [Neolentinus lepideus HHB14362 ss-1]